MNKNGNCKSLEEFKERLRKVMKSQNIRKFHNLLHYCPFLSFSSSSRCESCPLSDKNGPKELVGRTNRCLCGSMRDTYWDYYIYGRIVDEKTVLAEMVLIGIQLLAYLESKENE